MVAAAGIRMIELMTETNVLQDKLHRNAEYFITALTKLGFDIKPGKSAICAVMLYDAKLSQDFAARLLKEGIYVIGFFFPVVPKGQARIRVQLSAAHETEHLDKAIKAFEKIGKELGVLL
jgi:glycine C-acetyltransferase